MDRRRWQTVNLVTDCALLTIASFVACALPGEVGIHWRVALCMSASAMFFWGVVGRVIRHYDSGNGRNVRGDVALTVFLMAATMLPMIALRWLVPAYAAGSDPGRFAAVFVPGVMWMRLLTSWLRTRPVPAPDEVLILGVGPLGRHTGLEIRDGKPNRKVLGYLEFQGDATERRLPAPVLGGAGDLETLLRKHVVSEVYITAASEAQRSDAQDAIRVCERFGIPFALPVNRFRMGRAEPREALAVADGYVHYLCYRHKPVQLALKRAFDIVSSASALAVLTPLFLVVAALIKLTSRGPILFKQLRVGLHGRPFYMLKFRSMVVNAEELKAKLLTNNEQTGPVFKMARDPRVTAIGRFIRKYSIDELPQLINVLRGEMTIVGPRPPIPAEVQKYEAWQRRRLSVRPGLTCVWQVSGRNEIGFEEWMYLDMQYIDHFSLAQDFRLIFKTLPVVLLGRGAS
jgi:exopolysaccharide biosynthesis polyprenyl glycosylphosphotransferase